VPDEERRSGVPSRRRDDLIEWRLDHLEHDVTALVTRVDTLQADLAVSALDLRYVQRVELKEQRTRVQGLARWAFGAAIAVTQLALAYAALKHGL
jgi:hypothetical protein